MRAMCFGPPNQGGLPSPEKKSINGRTWQVANVSGLGHTQYDNMI